MSYLPKVMKPITVIGTIDPKKEYTTTEAIRVVSCGPHTLIECAMAGDMPAKQVVEKGRWRFVGSDLIDLSAFDVDFSYLVFSQVNGDDLLVTGFEDGSSILLANQYVVVPGLDEDDFIF